MTLDEAIAQYAIERDDILNELHPYAGDYPGTSISWHRERDRLALDAAVRDVALALIDEAMQENMTLHMVRQRRVRLEAEIKRQFGLPEKGAKEGRNERILPR